MKQRKSDVSLEEKHGNPINRGLLEGLNEHLTCLGSWLAGGSLAIVEILENKLLMTRNM